MLSEAVAQRIEIWPIDRLVFYSKNPRKNDAAVDRMVASIREYGFKIPVLARSSGEVVDGHLRLKAARKLGIAEVPVILCDEWSDAQVKAFRLLVNRSANWAAWDDELVARELADLKASTLTLASRVSTTTKLITFCRTPTTAVLMLSRRFPTTRSPGSVTCGCWESIE